MLKSVLSFANSEQNQTYPPYIYTDQYNAVTSLLLSALAKKYSDDKEVQDMIMPFMETKKIAVTEGFVELPDDYRNLLGNPSISIKPDGSDCADAPRMDTASEFKVANLKGGCKTRPVVIVPQTEWDYLTTSEYNYPTIENPIGCFFGAKKLKVCPYDIGKVEVRYARQEKVYRYGYIMQPDDTYILDVATSEESEWTSAAFEPIFKALSSLYAAYTRDTELRDWSLILTEKGIL